MFRSFFFKLSIKNRLTLLLFVMACVVVGAFALAVYLRFSETQRKTIHEWASNQSELSALELEGYLTGIVIEEQATLNDFLMAARLDSAGRGAQAERILQTLRHLRGKDIVGSFIWIEEERGFYYAEINERSLFHEEKLASIPGFDANIDNTIQHTPHLSEPYWHVRPDGDSIGVARLSVPVMDKGRFRGLVGVELDLGTVYQGQVAPLVSREHSYLIWNSNQNNRYYAPPSITDRRKKTVIPFGDDMAPEARRELHKAVQNGASYILEKLARPTKKISYFYFSPVTLPGNEPPSSIAVVFAMDDLLAPARATFYLVIVLALLVSAIWAAAFHYIFGKVFVPFQKTTAALHEITESGNLRLRLQAKTEDEAGLQDRAFNTLIRKAQETVANAKVISQDIKIVTDALERQGERLSKSIVGISNPATLELLEKSQIVGSKLLLHSDSLGKTANAFKVGDPPFDMTGLVYAHYRMLWNLKISHLYPELERPDLSDHHHCALGKWLYNEEIQERFKMSVTYHQLLTAHEKFHSFARQLITKPPKSAQANSLLHDMELCCSEVENALRQLFIEHLE